VQPLLFSVSNRVHSGVPVGTDPFSRRFRFGVTSRGSTSKRGWSDLARSVEGLGYSTLFVPDHFRDQLSPLPALAFAAGATSKLFLGTLVLANDFRHPAVLAKESASVDLLSDGRLELGIGAGWASDEYQEAGIEFLRAGLRVDRLSESVQILKKLLAGERVEYHGRFYDVNGLEGKPLPVRRPRPPLLIGGGGRRVLDLAAREAEIVGISVDLRSGQTLNPSAKQFGSGAIETATTSAVYERVTWVRESAGSRFGSLELNVRAAIVAVTNDASRVAEEFASTLGISADDVVASPHVIVGDVGSIRDSLIERRERFGITYIVVPEDAYLDFAPVVSALSGQ
jgi:probable F420-dependent oxidoreductase